MVVLQHSDYHLEIFGGQEGVVSVRDGCGEVLTALSDAEAGEFLSITKQNDTLYEPNSTSQ